MQSKTRQHGSQRPSSVVVLHEDGATREQALRFCDYLVQRFWATSLFEINWWSIGQLAEPPFPTQAAEQAAAADLILFAIHPEGDLTPELRGWINDWLARRGEREGALVGLLDPAAKPNGRSTERYTFLRHAAHQGGMDYFTHIPAVLPHSLPDSLEYCRERAAQMTSVLDEILHRPVPVPHLTP